MRLINFTSKCQSKSIEEQYNAGVRYFDIRVCIGKHDTMPNCYAHGLIKYDIKHQPILQGTLLRDGVVGRIILEKGNKEAFRRYIDILLSLPTVAEHIHYAVDNKKTWNIYRKGAANMTGYNIIENYPQYPIDGIIPNPRVDNEKFMPITQEMIESNRFMYLCDFV